MEPSAEAPELKEEGARTPLGGRPRRYSNLDTMSSFDHFYDKRRGYAFLDPMSSMDQFYDNKRYNYLDTMSAFDQYYKRSHALHKKRDEKRAKNRR